MGDINFDLTKTKRFNVIPYTLAVAGAAAGVGAAIATAAVLPAASVLAAAGVIGALAGGIALPTALTALVGAVGFIASGARMELKAIPFGMAVVGISCSKALFVTPLQAAFKGLRSVFNPKAKRPASPPAAPKNAPKNTPKPPQP